MKLKIEEPKRKDTSWNPFKMKITGCATVKGSEGTYTIICRENIFIRRYTCTCPDAIWRNRTCKHIRAFKRQRR